VENHACYVGSVWDGELRLTAKTRDMQDKIVFKTQLGADPRIKKPSERTEAELEGFDGGAKAYVLAGIAAHDGILVCSMIRQNELLFVDAKEGKLATPFTIENPRGVNFDGLGRLLILSGKSLLRSASIHEIKPEVIIASGLDDPRQVATDADGNFYITDQGASHQVKVFSPKGKLLRAIGKAGTCGRSLRPAAYESSQRVGAGFAGPHLGGGGG